MVKDLPEITAKPALQKLLKLDDYKCEKEVMVHGVWNIIVMVGQGSGKPDKADVLAQNIVGEEDEVRKFAQEAFGFFPERPLLRFELRPSTTKLSGLTDVKKLLTDCGISGKPLPSRYESEHGKEE